MESASRITQTLAPLSKKEKKAAKLAAYPSATQGQRTLGGELPRMFGVSSGIGSGRRDIINNQIDAFNKAQTPEEKRRLLIEIKRLATLWHDKFKGSHFFNAESKAQKAAMILSLKTEIQAELDYLEGRGEPSPRGSLTILPMEELIEEVPVSEKDELIRHLKGLGYEEDRNYYYFNDGNDSTHVSWKLHVNASEGERFEIIKRLAFLRKDGISHKFDVSDKAGQIDKFLTVYQPSDASEEFWSSIVEQITDRLGGLANTAVSGDMEVASTKPGISGTGKAFMRHGQNTTLSPEMAKDFVCDSKEKWMGYAVYKPLRDGVIPEGSQLLCAGNKLFFNKKPGTPIPVLSPVHIYMAILFGGKIVPDKREEPNPANAPLPKGLRQV